MNLMISILMLFSHLLISSEFTISIARQIMMRYNAMFMDYSSEETPPFMRSFPNMPMIELVACLYVLFSNDYMLGTTGEVVALTAN